MKCPKCRREVAFTAMSCSCGWKAVTPPPAPVASSSPPPEPRKPLPPEVQAKLDAILKRSKRYKEKPEEKKPKPLAAIREVTEGHGPCTCEVCFPKRMRPHAKRDVDSGQAGAPEEISRGEAGET